MPNDHPTKKEFMTLANQCLSGSKGRLKPEEFNQLQKIIANDIGRFAQLDHTITQSEKVTGNANIDTYKADLKDIFEKYNEINEILSKNLTNIYGAVSVLDESPDVTSENPYQKLHVPDSIPQSENHHDKIDATPQSDNPYGKMPDFLSEEKNESNTAAPSVLWVNLLKIEQKHASKDPHATLAGSVGPAIPKLVLNTNTAPDDVIKPSDASKTNPNVVIGRHRSNYYPVDMDISETPRGDSTQLPKSEYGRLPSDEELAAKKENKNTDKSPRHYRSHRYSLSSGTTPIQSDNQKNSNMDTDHTDKTTDQPKPPRPGSS